MNDMLSMLPFNISLLILNAENTRGLRPVKVLDIFQSGGKNFHEDGLFSIETFGKPGDERRNRLFAYMNLNLSVFHPVIFKNIVELKELYGKIMAGTAYAIFNEKTKDFEVATLATGETGFQFFVKHFPNLAFEERKSTSREFSIRLVNENRTKCMMDKMIVMPAGLRDFTILPNNKPEEDEINTLYRQTLSIANVVGTHGNPTDASHMDATRYRLQLSVVAIYEYIVNLLEGKSKLIQGWWTSRTIFNSTRNVITANVSRCPILGGPTTVGPNDTVVGLYQGVQGIFPLAVNLIRELSSQVFPGPNAPAVLVNRKTLMKETIQVSSDYYDAWMTQEGLESTVGRFETELLRHDAIAVSHYYFGLIYNDGKRVRFLQGLEDLPEGFDKQYVTPITYAELFYLAIYKRMREIPAFVTRYPILGFGGIYPSTIYLRTTTRAQCLEVLGEDWEPTGETANEFPLKGTPFVNSMSPSISHLGRLGAD